MSILVTSESGWIISHLHYLNEIYKQVEEKSEIKRLKFNQNLFEINSQYLRQNQVENFMQKSTENLKKKKRKRNTTLPTDILKLNDFIKQASAKILDSAKISKLFTCATADYNLKSREESKKFYLENLHSNKNFYGSNQREVPIIAEFHNEKYIFPEKCEFYCFDIKEINKKFDSNHTFDLILLDPPWWNKSINRKKMKFEQSSYQMMDNKQIAKIPIQNFLSSQGLVVVWCTNSLHHIKSLKEEIFPSWGVTFKARWYWLKITQYGEPICDFNNFHGKLPYEQIIIGTTSNFSFDLPDNKIIISSPSAVHSHKPPLSEILKPLLPKNPKCLEIFARYLLPNWSSWGLEVLKFQHSSLYTEDDENIHAEND